MSVIKLLDNSLWDEAKLIDEMQSDEFYYGYLGKAALSSSSIKLLLDSPRTYYNVTKYSKDTTTPALFLGRLIHHLALEPHVVPHLYELSDVKSRNTKAYKEQQENTDKWVVLPQEWANAEKAIDALQRNEAFLECTANAEFEQAAVVTLEGIPFRVKADILHRGVAVMDLKTTSDLSGFKYSANKYGYDVQAYIYCTAFGVPFDTFKFIAVDKKSGDIGIYTVTEEFFNRGREKTNYAIEQYKYYFPDGIDAEGVTDKLDQYYIKGEL